MDGLRDRMQIEYKIGPYHDPFRSTTEGTVGERLFRFAPILTRSTVFLAGKGYKYAVSNTFSPILLMFPPIAFCALFHDGNTALTFFRRVHHNRLGGTYVNIHVGILPEMNIGHVDLEL